MSEKPSVVYEYFIEPEDLEVRGNAMASDDKELDREVEDAIIARLDRGEIEAWCYFKVTATLEFEGETFKGCAGIGGNSYDTEKELVNSLFTIDEFGLKKEAFDDLKRSLQAARVRGNVASAAQDFLRMLKDQS